MKKSTLAALAAISSFAIAGPAMAEDSPVAYLGTTAGGSAYGSAFSSEHADAVGFTSGAYSVQSVASQNVAVKQNDDKKSDRKGDNDNHTIKLTDFIGKCTDLGECASQTASLSAGSFSGTIGPDGGLASGYTGGESIAQISKLGTDVTIATAEHHALSSMATSGAGSYGTANNSGFAVSKYNSDSNGTATVWAD